MHADGNFKKVVTIVGKKESSKMSAYNYFKYFNKPILNLKGFQRKPLPIYIFTPKGYTHRAGI